MFQFQEEKKVSQLVNSKKQPIRSGEQGKTSDLADASESDSEGDSQSDKGDCFLFGNLFFFHDRVHHPFFIKRKRVFNHKRTQRS